MDQYPNTASFQMETYHLFHLAKLSEYAAKDNDSIRVASCAIVLANRQTHSFFSNEHKHELEKQAGKACLEALFK